MSVNNTKQTKNHMAKNTSKENAAHRDIRLAKAAGIESLPKIKKTNLELSGATTEALARIKANHGMSMTFAIEKSVLHFEAALQGRK